MAIKRSIKIIGLNAGTSDAAVRSALINTFRDSRVEILSFERTALVEALVLLIVNGDAPPLLMGSEIMGFDLGLPRP